YFMKTVFDTSAVLAILYQENGAEIAEQQMSQALLSVVNFAEVISVLSRHSAESTIRKSIRPFENKVVPYDQSTAMQTGLLAPYTQKYGLSLGDRACIALGMCKKLPILTADKIWDDLDIDADIQLIR
ncbi:MAG: type II toxin-antitoxin system VapC family toxin, partial [Cyanobacteria bacterium J06555_13]